MDRVDRSLPMSLRKRAARRLKDQGVNDRSARSSFYLLAVAGGIVVLLLAGLIIYNGAYRERIYAGVRVITPPTTIDVGGKTRVAATAALKPFATREGARIVTLVTGTVTRRQRARDLGYSVDASLTAWRCSTVGRTGSLPERISGQLSALATGAEVSVAQRVDRNTLDGYLSKLARILNRRPRPGSPGRTLDIAASRASIIFGLLHDATGFTIHLPFHRVPALPLHRPRAQTHRHAARPIR